MKKVLFTLFAVLSLATAGSVVTTADVSYAAAKDQITTSINNINDGNTTDLGDGITKSINMLLFIIGAISTLVIIIGGVKYVTSNGESSAIQSAKNTIMYAVIGLIVAIMAYAVVNFVVGSFTS